MGRDNHNAGLHLVPQNYRTSFDSKEEWDKYAEILSTQNKQSIMVTPPFYGDTRMTQIIRKNNVVIWERKGQESACDCGTKLKYSDNLDLKWSEMGKEKGITITGKFCPSCNKKYVVRSCLITELGM